MLNLIMTKSLVAAVTRHLMTSAGGWLMASGYADAASVDLLTGGAVAATGIVWSFAQKRF